MKPIFLALLAAAAISSATPAFSADASPEVQKEFAGYMEKFRAAVKPNDAKAIVGLTKTPFMSHTDEYDARAFETKVYKKEFTEKTRACIQSKKPEYDRSPDNTEYYYINCGSEMFQFTKTSTGFLFTEISEGD